MLDHLDLEEHMCPTVNPHYLLSVRLWSFSFSRLKMFEILYSTINETAFCKQKKAAEDLSL